VPRKSPEAKSLLPRARVPLKRPEPPENLPEAARDEWRRIVAAMPADWFTEEMWPLLSALCGVSVTLGRITRELNCQKKIDGSGFAELSRLQATLSEQVMRMSTKLRLTPMSRYNTNRATEATKEAVALRTSRQPWAKGRNGEAKTVE
jgi:phage terminase small subunit